MSPAASRRRLTALVLVALVALPLVMVAAEPASADYSPGVDWETESPDFASQVYGDPWDYSNPQDQNTDASSTHGISVSGGRLNLTLAGGDWFSPVTTQPNALSWGRDGSRLPVDSTRYRLLSFSLDQPTSGTGAVYWFTCGGMVASCAGGTTFALQPGNHEYSIKLTGPSTIAAHKPWLGSRIVGFRIVPSVSASPSSRFSASFDWMRLVQKVGGSAEEPPQTISTFQIVPLPIPVVDSPSSTQGVDVTTAQHRPQWVFTTSANGTRISVRNALVKGYGSTGLTAVNSGRLRNDPQILLPISHFAGSTFRYLSFSMTYDGPFGLADAPGGGKMSRLIWGVTGTTRLQESNDIVTYGGINAETVSIDLGRKPVLDENSLAPRRGWSGQTITSLRFDPNEDPGAAVWHLRSLHLRAAPTAKKATTIVFHDSTWMSGSTARIQVRSGSLWHTVAAGIPVTSGKNSYHWALGTGKPGSYEVRVAITHPDGGTGTAASSAPIVMSR